MFKWNNAAVVFLFPCVLISCLRVSWMQPNRWPRLLQSSLVKLVSMLGSSAALCWSQLWLWSEWTCWTVPWIHRQRAGIAAPSLSLHQGSVNTGKPATLKSDCLLLSLLTPAVLLPVICWSAQNNLKQQAIFIPSSVSHAARERS